MIAVSVLVAILVEWIGRRPGERLEASFLQRRHNGPTPGVMGWRAIPRGRWRTPVVIPRALTEHRLVPLYLVAATAKRALTANVYIRLLIKLSVLTFITIPGRIFQPDIAHSIPLPSYHVLYGMSTCYLGLRDYQIFLPTITYRALLDDKSIIISTRTYRVFI
ncbi:hypothetical protein AVEN_233684-1 [Araneus ventricosus]|uniref:Uncharacterized protein n=1 Tax=Araneus ventricosus TaxID=182803 RepID=A0A4Y2Q0E5_ARAVE|nr:hypothetical protein AVEN_233684-1 [Araneus ventricosus]